MPQSDRAIVIGALAAIVVLAWLYILWAASSATMRPSDTGSMSAGDMAAMMSPRLMPWTPGHAFFVFVMWAVMMIGMMTPSAAPMVLTYTMVARQAATTGRTFAASGWFASGYLLVWVVFAAAATMGQWALEQGALLTPMMATASFRLGGALLLAAGIYQWTPVKTACLSHCRVPLSFVQRHGGFKPSAGGSVRLGLLHGAYCVGCCWALMALLFVGGVMNVLWVAGLTTLVLAEKLLPLGNYLAKAAGAAIIAAGVWMLAVA